MMRFTLRVSLAIVLWFCIAACGNERKPKPPSDSTPTKDSMQWVPDSSFSHADSAQPMEPPPQMPVGVAIRNSTNNEVTFYLSYNGTTPDVSYTTAAGYSDDYVVRSNRVYMIIPGNQGTSASSTPYKTILKRGGYYHIIKSGNGFAVAEE